MSELMTPAEALARWPEDIYPPDTLGGMQRNLIVRAWELVDELKEQAEGTPSENVAAQVAESFLAELADGQQRIDELQDAGLRRAFRELMGYDLPGGVEGDEK